MISDIPVKISFSPCLRIQIYNDPVKDLRGAKNVALMAYLAFRAPHPLSRDHLIDILWPEVETPVGRNRLSTCLSVVRRACQHPLLESDDWIEADHRVIQLNTNLVCTEVAALRAYIDGSAFEEPKMSLMLARCIQGRALSDLYEPWITDLQLDYEELITEALPIILDRLLIHQHFAEARQLIYRFRKLEPDEEWFAHLETSFLRRKRPLPLTHEQA